MMKNLIVIVLGILMLAATTTTSFAQSDSSNRLAGTWDAVVTPRVCATGDPITTFQATYIFTTGGTFSGVSSGTGSGGRGREQLGVWKHVNSDQYRFRIKTFLFDAFGVATSYQIVTHDGELDFEGRNWSSIGDSRTYSLAGVEINVGCSTIFASRTPQP